MDTEAVQGVAADAAAPVSADSVSELVQRDIDRLRVDVAKLCSTRNGRKRVYRVLLQVDRWGLLRDLAAYIRVEKGAAARAPVGAARGLARSCDAAILTGLNLFDEFSHLMRCVLGAWPYFVRVAEKPDAYEAIVHQHLQRWLDALAESIRHVNEFVLEWIAGFGGCGVDGLRRYGSSSGVEAMWRVSWSVRAAITGEAEHPFAWLGLVAGEELKTFPATGRSAPARPDEVAADDRELLLAVAGGATTPKPILAMVAKKLPDLTYVRVRQRKQDLVRWGLLVRRRGVWELTATGKAWARVLEAPLAAGSGAPPPTPG